MADPLLLPLSVLPALLAFNQNIGRNCPPDASGRPHCIPSLFYTDSGLVDLKFATTADVARDDINLEVTLSSFRLRGETTDTSAFTIKSTRSFSTCSPPDGCDTLPRYNCRNCDNPDLFFGKFNLANGQVALQTTSLASLPVTVVQTSYCCSMCAATANCSYFEVDYGTNACTLFAAGTMDRFCGTLSSPEHFTGGPCNPSATGDPHFVGAQKTHYDFNGLPGESYCLVTDKDMHVNMAIEGYEGGSPPSLRTWIRGLSFFWMVDGREHTFALRTRSGPEVERGLEGYLLEARVDGKLLPRFKEDTPATFEDSESQLVFRFLGLGKHGKQDMEKYDVSVAGLGEMTLGLRPAIPQMRSPTDAYVHFDLQMGQWGFTEDVHGVLGQTYRPSQAERANYYKQLSKNIKGAMKALEQGVGEGFLDGTLADYRTTGLMDSKCPLSRFGGHTPVKTPVWTTPPAVTMEDSKEVGSMAE